ncbi:GAF domain-containing protein [Mycolicibacterium psychrotolerans]|uniref:GAF domain-containing protein n=1 Tax=Mycolicibacterium psychrotolerans TaxID=216929 RepID=A0A7I7MDL5_9MYCO|nr:GAF domain-containing protein [Mycolicibacterium psychrotolerans]BBX69890.1 hypothetical protein MPSYJ_33510 [Mycolicibacterium psychrotolerans]
MKSTLPRPLLIPAAGHTVPPMTSTLQALAHRCASLIPGTAGCGMTLLTADGRRITSVATDRVAERLNALHDVNPQNPCASAWMHDTVRRAHSSVTRLGWAPWMASAQGMGVRSVLAAPLCTPRRRLGWVFVYSTRADSYRHGHGRLLTTFAAAAAHRVDRCQNPHGLPG